MTHCVIELVFSVVPDGDIVDSKSRLEIISGKSLKSIIAQWKEKIQEIVKSNSNAYSRGYKMNVFILPPNKESKKLKETSNKFSRFVEPFKAEWKNFNKK